MIDIEKQNKFSAIYQIYSRKKIARGTAKEISELTGISKTDVVKALAIIKSGNKELINNALIGEKGNSIGSVYRELSAIKYDVDEENRLCCKCKKVKPKNEFSCNGKAAICLECERVRTAKYKFNKSTNSTDKINAEKAIHRLKNQDASMGDIGDIRNELIAYCNDFVNVLKRARQSYNENEKEYSIVVNEIIEKISGVIR